MFASKRNEQKNSEILKLVDDKKFEFLRFYFKNTSQHDGFVFFVTLKFSYVALSVAISKNKVWSPFTPFFLRKRYNTRYFVKEIFVL